MQCLIPKVWAGPESLHFYKAQVMMMPAPNLFLFQYSFLCVDLPSKIWWGTWAGVVDKRIYTPILVSVRLQPQHLVTGKAFAAALPSVPLGLAWSRPHVCSVFFFFSIFQIRAIEPLSEVLIIGSLRLKPALSDTAAQVVFFPRH